MRLHLQAGSHSTEELALADPRLKVGEAEEIRLAEKLGVRDIVEAFLACPEKRVDFGEAKVLEKCGESVFDEID
jgi:hypothetical protein